MAPLTLVIGNKNYSSWSLRPWLLMKRLGIAFDEVLITLDTPTTREDIEKFSPSGRVPVLRHGELTVWDSLAILLGRDSTPVLGRAAIRGFAHQRDAHPPQHKGDSPLNVPFRFGHGAEPFVVWHYF